MYKNKCWWSHWCDVRWFCMKMVKKKTEENICRKKRPKNVDKRNRRQKLKNRLIFWRCDWIASASIFRWDTSFVGAIMVCTKRNVMYGNVTHEFVWFNQGTIYTFCILKPSTTEYSFFSILQMIFVWSHFVKRRKVQRTANNPV